MTMFSTLLIVLVPLLFHVVQATPSYCGFPNNDSGSICSQTSTTKETCELRRYFTSTPCRWEQERCTSSYAKDLYCPTIIDQATCNGAVNVGPRYCVWYYQDDETFHPSDVPIIISVAPSVVPTPATPIMPMTPSPKMHMNPSPIIPGPSPMMPRAPSLEPSFSGPGYCGFPNDPDRICSTDEDKNNCSIHVRVVEKLCTWKDDDNSCHGGRGYDGCSRHDKEEICVISMYGAMDNCQWYYETTTATNGGAMMNNVKKYVSSRDLVFWGFCVAGILGFACVGGMCCHLQTKEPAIIHSLRPSDDVPTATVVPHSDLEAEEDDDDDAIANLFYHLQTQKRPLDDVVPHNDLEAEDDDDDSIANILYHLQTQKRPLGDATTIEDDCGV